MPAGTIVNPGSLVSPGGQQGISGVASWTVTSADFTVPAVGSTVVVNVQNSSWATVGEYIWVQSSPTVSDALKITAKTATTLTLLNPTTTGMQPSGDANNLLTLGSDSLLYLPPSAIQPVITSVRLRSFNAVGNPNFEVDQRNVGAISTNLAGNAFLMDRWSLGKAGTMTVNTQSLANDVFLPGTNFKISSRQCNVGLGTQQASLAATDFLYFSQTIEGPNWRELSGDVTSLSLLVWSGVAPLKFSVCLRSPDATRSWVQLCTITTASTWQLIQVPNIPVPSGGNFSQAPGVAGYAIIITLACGSTYIAPAAGTWQNGNFIGAPGMDNWASKPVNSLFVAGVVQHEPGAQCTTPIDCPFGQNYDGDMGCLRYYCKSYPYSTSVATVGFAAAATFFCPNAGSMNGPVIWPKRMAKAPPNIRIWNPSNGAPSSVYRGSDGAAQTITAAAYISDVGFLQLQGSTLTVGTHYLAQWDADTGW